MNVCDENIDADQREQLRAWKIHYRHIGTEIGRKGLEDRNEIIPLLHTLRRPTLFSRDWDFYKPDLRHTGYCLVYLNVRPHETARYIRRFLRHPSFRTQAQRMGKVIRMRQSGLTWWEIGARVEHAQSW
jgi:hypothetical protein